MEVKEEHFARISQEHLGDVEAMREEIRSMKDEALRAEQEQRIADHEVDVEMAKLDAVRADVDVAKAEVSLANATGERGLVDDAKLGLEQAEQQVDVQRWKSELAARERDALNLEAQVIRDRIGIAQAELEQAKIEALQASGDLAAEKYEAEAFAKQVENANKRLARTQELISLNEKNVQDAQAKLQEAESMLDPVRVRGEELELDGEDESDPREAEPPLEDPVPNEPGDGGMPEPIPEPQ